MTARYIDWTHIRVNGDRQAAAPYVADGRKLLGEVMEEAARNELGVLAMHRELEDGTIITAEKHGEIPRITITPAPPVPTIPPPVVRDDFVVWARTTALPAGIDADRPQQILRPAWTTFFNDSGVDGFEAFPGEKGTYGGMFPQGLLLAGNIDWVRPSTGERLSWYGPSSRYWYDDWRLPRAQYGVHVFHLGQVLLDVEAYANELDEPFVERWVLGAAMTQTHLYVVLADLPENISVDSPPATASQSPDSWSSPSMPAGAISVALRRFLLVHNPATPDPMQYTVPGNSHEELWAGTITRGVAPWHFSPDVTTAVAHIAPAALELTQRGAGVIYPSESHLRHMLEIEGAEAELLTEVVSLSANAPAVIAEDGEATLAIVRKPYNGFENALFYRIGEHDYLAMAVTEAPDTLRYDRRQIVWADLRAGTLLLLADSIQAGEWMFDLSFRLCSNGTEQVAWGDATAVVTLGSYDAVRFMLNETATRAVAPLALAHLNAYGAVDGGWPGGVHNAQVSLLHAHYWLPFRISATAGQTRFAFAAGAWSNLQSKAAVARNTGANTQVDGLGHTTLPGFATYKGYSVLSYSTNGGINGRRIKLDYITGSSLGAVTGVPGEDTTENTILGNDARYHPVWLLGARRRAA
ncbi:hypothetical protein [Luteimonas saliphila]|uniref:hypothetical protein n=1 Tax=Luteimonas saliphila TaxID=2804919 RepID=UPI00192DAD2C|nr:hypothetical protein [Luteimonas saliphila]